MHRFAKHLFMLVLLFDFLSVSEAYDAVYVPVEEETSVPSTPPTPEVDPYDNARAVLHPMADSNSNGNGDPNASVYQRQYSPERYKDTLPSIEREMPGGNKVILLPGH